jgi:cyclic beta-1,2-glucan synthetase
LAIKGHSQVFVKTAGTIHAHAAVWTLLAFAALSDGDKAGELFRLLNPVHRISSRSNVQRYRVEPYVVVGDVYAQPPHVGCGGWSWYSGAAGWLYRAGDCPSSSTITSVLLSCSSK